MGTRFLVRLDDACPTQRSEMWNALEETFDHLGIRPIVGVIPDNRDPALLCSADDGKFWDRVRR